MEKNICQLIYLSTASVPFSKDDLRELLARSRVNNAKREVTGLLLYQNGVFQQILEGPVTAVHSLYDVIQKDTRHHGLIKLVETFAGQREFPEWSMGFYDLASPEAAALPGYSPFLNTPLNSPEYTANPSVSWRLMRAFKKNLRP